MDPAKPRSVNAKKRKPKNVERCCCCKQEFRFVWSCRCGFVICQSCMQENLWGMTCNHITWVCPDCGDWNGFGNQ